ncbi:ABC transporter substrate-binding protein [Candidatus Gracilibacteria bacterium]|nr:ABC transporter substrate-binding protein [Candidatus Gracilibacteria bacterium]
MKKLLISAGILVLSLAGCAAPSDDNAATELESYKIGAILPLTGDAAAYGEPLQKVAEIALEKVNEERAERGALPIEFLWQDGKCNGRDAASAAQKLINVDKVQIIYGAFCSSETLGAAPVAEAAGVVMLSPGSSSPDITNAGDYIFRNYPSDSSQGVITAGIATELGLEKIGMLTEENDYTIGINTAFTEAFDGEVVSQNFLPDDTDFKTQITKLKGAGVDAIFINPQTPPKADLILKQLQEQGVDGIQLFANDVVMSYSEGLGQYTALVEGMLGAETSYNTGHRDYVYFTEKYKEMTGEEVPFQTYAATVFDAVRLIDNGLDAVGNDGDAFRDWLYTVQGWEGVAGELDIDSNGDPKAGHKAKVIKNGKSELR